MYLNYFSKNMGSTTQTKPQNEDECYSEPTDTYECHICNVHVPVKCSEKHNDSEQHKTIKNIYQKVFEKLSKQMDTNIVKHDENFDNDSYYCVPCSKIIKQENKTKHESSEFHAKSNKDANIISEFYKIINENRNHTDDIVLIDERLNKDSDFEHESCILNNATTNNKLAIPPPSNEDNKIQPPNDKKTESFKQYLKAMIKKYKLRVNLPIVMLDKIWIEDLNGDVFMVSPENFQSYKQAKNSIYCQLCKLWLSLDTRAHEITENHVRNIFKPINKKFARTIDSVSSHCVPCNVVVLTNSSHHTLDENHRNIVQDKRAQQQGETFCEVCKLFIHTHNFAVHITSKEHVTQVLVLNYITRSTDYPNLFFCDICKITLLKSGIKNHIVAKIHLNRINKHGSKIVQNVASDLGNMNTDSTTINDKSAKVAKINDKSTCFAAQVNGKQHKNKIVQLKQNDIKSTENKVGNGNGSSTSITLSNASIRSEPKIDEYYVKYLTSTDDTNTTVCQLCNVNVSNSDRNIINHVESKDHSIAETKVLKIHHMTKTPSRGYFCKCCDEDTKDSLEHINSKSHTNALLANDKIDQKEIKKYVYEDQSNDLVARCYRGLYGNLLIYNDIYKVNDANYYFITYYCGMCQMKLARISELYHVFGKSHTSKLAEIQNP